EDAVVQPRALLPTDPEAAVRGLKRSAAGCRWLLAQWDDLSFELERDGFWYAASQRDQAIRLLGLDPAAHGQDEVYWLRLLNVAAHPRATPERLAPLLDPQ